MGGPAKEQLDLLDQRIKLTLRPLINSINISGMNRERRIQLDQLLLEISELQQTVDGLLEHEGSTEGETLLAGLVDYLYSLIRGAQIPSSISIEP